MANTNTKNSDPGVNVNEVSRIAQGVVVKGDISSLADIRIDGQVDGTVFSDGKVVVGETARLSGNLLCTTVDLWGKMDGDIYVKDILSLKSSSIVNGNIYVRKLQVEMGAQINGSCKMIDEQEFGKYSEAVVKNAIVAAPDSAPVSKKK